MIYLAGDHRGFLRKEQIKKYLDELQRDYIDCGNLILDPNDDEVDFVAKACERIKADLETGSMASRGIFFCGSGVMVDIAANRFSGVRACLALNKKQVTMARNDDDVNGLCIATDFFNVEESQKVVLAFLRSEFSGEERFVRRIGKLKTLIFP